MLVPHRQDSPRQDKTRRSWTVLGRSCTPRRNMPHREDTSRQDVMSTTMNLGLQREVSSPSLKWYVKLDQNRTWTRDMEKKEERYSSFGTLTAPVDATEVPKQKKKAVEPSVVVVPWKPWAGIFRSVPGVWIRRSPFFHQSLQPIPGAFSPTPWNGVSNITTCYSPSCDGASQRQLWRCSSPTMPAYCQFCREALKPISVFYGECRLLLSVGKSNCWGKKLPVKVTKRGVCITSLQSW